MNIDLVDKDTNTLHLPFCDHDDSGEYTCMLSTDYSLLPSLNRSVQLLVKATLALERRTYCDTSKSIELNCTLQWVGAIPVSWIHSNAGETIRLLEGKHIKNSNILTIPFCNSQDTGDYTCRWKTDILGQTLMETSTTLSVSGPPFFISQFTTVDGSDTVFSVTFFSKPYPNDPQWYVNNEPVALGAKFQQTTSYTIVQIRQHGVLVNEEGFISNLTVHKAEYGLYKCVIINSFREVTHLFDIEQEHNTFSIGTTEATTSSETSGNSVTVIIAISSSVLGVVIVVICIIIFIRRISPKTSDLTEVPKDIPNEAYYVSITGTNITTIKRGDFNNMPKVARLYVDEFKF
ncbi:uncharacterized protein LOC134688185 [Mytilus trossulus]|uniref:uncharacterized protein LOC134688185 n=1 Tax=Mytilus trossulus TaxID=6551 RepID=UPI003006E0A7